MQPNSGEISEMARHALINSNILPSGIRFFIVLCCMALSMPSGAQVLSEMHIDTTLLEKLEFYKKAHPENLLFVHTDKTVYTNNETIWFSAYLLRSETDHFINSILSAALVKENEDGARVQEKYAMENGLSFGSLDIPDSVPPGNYRLIFSGDVVGKDGRPLAVFMQPLTLKSITQQSFSAELNLIDSVVTNGVLRARLTVSIKDPDPKKKIKPAIEYSIGKGTRGSANLTENNYQIVIPEADLKQPESTLLTSVRYNKEIQHLSLKLPEIKGTGINIRFFPEGGSLSNGLKSRVAWEARSNRNTPVSLSGILYRDNIPQDTLATNSYGIGTFKLRPDRDSQYTFKILSDEPGQDTAYKLPVAYENNLVLTLPETVVNDTLRISLSSNKVMTSQILVHNYRKASASVLVQLKPGDNKIAVVLPVLPKGIASVTILDQAGKPLAERLFFARYDQKIKTDIKPDKSSYNRKEKVHVKLKLTDQAGEPVQGAVLSVATVQDNRIEGNKFMDIETYTYLNHDLGVLPRDPQGRGFDNKEYLENMLLTKGWRRYTWPDLEQATQADSVQSYTTLQLTGQALHFSKPLKKATTVSIMRDSAINWVETSPDGSFQLDRDHLLTEPGRKVALLVNKPDKNDYSVEINDPFEAGIQKLASEPDEIIPSAFAQNLSNSISLSLPGFKNVIALNEIKVVANKVDTRLYYTEKKYGNNSCGDYVCRYGYFNCPYHGGEGDNTQPVKGQHYILYPSGGITYMGCMLDEQKDSPIFKIQGVYLAKEFYGAGDDPATEGLPQFLSTLYWQPGLMSDKNGEAEFSFLTGDITGRFRIILQGNTKKELVFGESGFVVGAAGSR